MERLSKVACYFRWMKNTPPHDASKAEDERKTVEDERHRNVGCSFEASRRLCGILESILLWENSVNSISIVIVFNILFWWVRVVLQLSCASFLRYTIICMISWNLIIDTCFSIVENISVWVSTSVRLQKKELSWHLARRWIMNITIFPMLFCVSLFSTNKPTTTTFHKKFMRINSSRRETFGLFLNAFEVIYLLGQGL